MRLTIRLEPPQWIAIPNVADAAANIADLPGTWYERRIAQAEGTVPFKAGKTHGVDVKGNNRGNLVFAAGLRDGLGVPRTNPASKANAV